METGGPWRICQTLVAADLERVCGCCFDQISFNRLVGLFQTRLCLQILHSLMQVFLKASKLTSLTVAYEKEGSMLR